MAKKPNLTGPDRQNWKKWERVEKVTRLVFLLSARPDPLFLRALRERWIMRRRDTRKEQRHSLAQNMS